jgi:hypothetical protein
MQRYLETGEKRIIGRKRQVRARRKDGSEFEIELGVQEATNTSGEKVFCGYIRDLTETRMTQRKMQQQRAIIKDKFFGPSATNSNDLDSSSSGRHSHENSTL